MKTVFDWITMVIFAGLVVLFLQRSTSEGPAKDSVWHYIPAGIGCALANYLGNHGQEIPAIVVVVAVIAYTLYVLKPLGGLRS